MTNSRLADGAIEVVAQADRLHHAIVRRRGSKTDAPPLPSPLATYMAMSASLHHLPPPVAVPAAPEADADAGADRAIAAGHAHRLAKVGEQPVRQLAGHALRGASLDEDGELVAPQPRDRVLGRGRCGRSASATAMRSSSPGLVAVGVVDRLEVVEVEEQDGHRLVALGERPLEPIAEQDAVGEAGERVVEGAMLELLLERAAACRRVERRSLTTPPRRVMTSRKSTTLPPATTGTSIGSPAIHWMRRTPRGHERRGGQQDERASR